MTDFTLGPGPLMPEFEQIKSDIGIVENGATATHAISSGSYVIWNGDLYVAKTDISSGTALSTSNLTPKTSGIGGEVKSLSEKAGTYVFESDTLENTQTAIYNYVANMADGEQKRIRFGISAISGIFSATSYIGYLRRLSRTRFVVTAQQAINNTRIFVGRYKDGVWDWQQTAFKSDTDDLSERLGKIAVAKNLGSISTLTALGEALVSAVSQATVYEILTITFYAGANFGYGAFNNGSRYQGTLNVVSKTGTTDLYLSIIFESSKEEPPVRGNYNNGTWTWKQLATSDMISRHFYYYTPSGTSLQSVVRAYCEGMLSSFAVGETAVVDLTCNGVVYCGLWWKATDTVMFGRMWTSNLTDSTGFTFRWQSGETSATIKEFNNSTINRVSTTVTCEANTTLLKTISFTDIGHTARVINLVCSASQIIDATYTWYVREAHSDSVIIGIKSNIALSNIPFSLIFT